MKLSTRLHTALRIIAMAAGIACANGAFAQQKPVGREVVFKTVGGRQLHLYISSPAADGKLHAAIVTYHGGGWTMGDVTQFNKLCAYLATRGMVAMEAEYRLIAKDGVESPQTSSEDAKSAMRWVRAHAAELHIDPNRIATGGGSAGGYLAIFDSLIDGWSDPADDQKISPKPNAVVMLFPVVDTGPEGYGVKRFGPTYAVYSPTDHVADHAGSLPPMLIQGGLDDKLVKPQTLRDFKAKVDKAGGRCDLILYADQPHGFSNKEPYATITLNAIARFFEALGYLAPGPPATLPDGTVPDVPAGTVSLPSVSAASPK